VTSACCLLLTLAAAGQPASWPGFLGAGAAVPPAESLPLAWSPDRNIAWRAELPGYGQSSPVVWGDKVLVTSVEGPLKDRYHVLAYALADGQRLWSYTLESSDPVKSSLYVSRAAPTPATDGQAAYAFFESGDVAAVSLDGKELWRRSLSADYGKFQNEFGLAASPVLVGDALVVLIDHQGPSYLIALDKSDGKTLWKTDRTPRTSWSSPAVVPLGGRPQIVCSSAGSVDGYDPATGKLLWSLDEVAGNTAATPLSFADGRFLVGASPGREGGARAEGARQSNLALAIEATGDGFVPRVLWRSDEAMPSFGSPVVHAGQAYWVNRVGVVYCFDAATGEPHYVQRTKQSVWATPLGVGDRVYLFGKEGLTTVLRAGPKFEVLAENQLWDPAAVRPDPALAAAEDTEERRRAAEMFSGPVQYGIAAVPGSLFVRTGNVLYCLRP
jgi:outer membrane protein assembly factor BamB